VEELLATGAKNANMFPTWVASGACIADPSPLGYLLVQGILFVCKVEGLRFVLGVAGLLVLLISPHGHIGTGLRVLLLGVGRLLIGIVLLPSFVLRRHRAFSVTSALPE
jgi:hypothetical protein